MRLSAVLLVTLVTGAAAAWWWSTLPPPPARTDWRLRAQVLAGTGVAGTADGPADAASFADPFGVAVAPDGSLLVTDGDRLRAVAPDGSTRTLAGGEPGFADGPAHAARFSTLSGVAVDAAGTVYLADTGNHAIRAVSPDGHVTTLAGTGRAGHRDGIGSDAAFDGPMGLALDPSGTLYIADAYNDAIRVLTPDGRVTTLAGGGGPGRSDGTGPSASFDTPTGLALHPSGDLVVADAGNGLLRRVSTRGEVETIPLHGVSLTRPLAVAVSGGGVIHVTDEHGAVVRRAPDGSAQLVAGGSGPGYADGLGATARFRRPAGLAWTPVGRLAVADTGNALLRLLSDPEVIALDPPASPRVAPRFDTAAFGALPLLWPVAPFDGPHEVAGTHGEHRGGDAAPRFHRGVDIRMPQGTPVHAVRPGVVSSPFGNGAVGTINEWVRVGDVTYVHIRAGRGLRDKSIDVRRYKVDAPEGRLERLRVRRGARFASGERVGTVNAFNHVHMAVGWPGDDHNPLGLRLVRFHDSIPPTIAPGGIHLYDAAGRRLSTVRDGRTLVHGRVQIVVDAWDQADGNVPWRRLGLHTLGYQVLHPDGTPAPGFEHPRITQRFDRLDADGDAPARVYAPGSGIPAYGSRRTRFLYVITTLLEDGRATWDAWDTRLLPTGDYVLRVHAADVAGNTAVARRDVAVTVLGE